VVDNVEIPNINAFANFASAGGTVSLLDAELIQDVTFLTGGYAPRPTSTARRACAGDPARGQSEEVRRWATLGFAGAGASSKDPSILGRVRGWCRRDAAS
jgi:hypothetical protein